VDVEALIAVEEIGRLKARYFRLVDAKAWDELGDVFTDDCEVRFGETDDDRTFTGRERIVKVLSRALVEGSTIHHGHMPEIEVTGPTTATGTWSMYDRVEVDPPSPLRLHGWGHYHESYARGDDGRWRIARLQLTRLRVDPL
jgi:hypothetical protein